MKFPPLDPTPTNLLYMAVMFAVGVIAGAIFG